MIAFTKQVFHFSRVWGSRHGGSSYSEELIAELARRGWSVCVLAERFENPFDNVVPLEHFFRNDPFDWLRKLAEIFRLSKLIARPVEALVIVQGDLPRLSYLLWQFFVPVILLRQDAMLSCPGGNRVFPRSRVVCDQPLGLQCLQIHQREGCLRGESWLHRIGRLGYRTRDAMFLRGITNFVANSRYTLRVHRKSGFLLYPPRLTNRLPTAAVARDLKRLVFCGRLEEVKGASDAIAILKLLPVEYHLDVLGDGVERPRLLDQAKRDCLVNRVKFHGWVDAAARDSCMRSAGVVLIPSLWDEAFGMAGPEAFAMGTPVVAYDVGGISEWCREGSGILVHCGDVRHAAAAVLQLTQDPGGWRAWSAAARRIADEEFPPSRFGEELDGILNRVFPVFACQPGATLTS